MTEQVLCVPFCCYRRSEQTCLSIYLRITYCVIGVLLVTVGALSLSGVNAFSGIGSEAVAFLSVGIVLFLFSGCCKCVKLKKLIQKNPSQFDEDLNNLMRNFKMQAEEIHKRTEELNKPENWNKPGRDFLKHFPNWMVPSLEKAPFFEVMNDENIGIIQTYIRHPIITYKMGNEVGFALRLKVQHRDLAFDLSEDNLNEDSSKSITLPARISLDESGKYVLRSKLAKPSDLPFESSILLDSQYKTLHLDDASAQALTLHKKQDDPTLADGCRFSIEWLLINLWDKNQPCFVCQYPSDDSKQAPIGYWRISLVYFRKKN